ncbi:helix-turn-helix domain-containing protein [Xylocopilactobacillus apicola]|uniref:HTH cro/C1-type domain-containing protein n=1 Tax=Xylocopilactobacillus apicola TaxID=2932184 RepID=A0AAU9D400_9LACO|nr:helix-turn-helix domain-containing protein [Xylocopilactobacillus apicola]BDR59556.1 hypothetical protein XA3_19970 [Xylocopilactobacillus apicola]
MYTRQKYNALKGWLVTNGISQREVAELLETKPGYINKRLNGVANDFRAGEIKLMHDKLGIPLDVFF